jgi:hypothetical protein
MSSGDTLCRYITRPALSDERVQLDAAGQVELKLKAPWRDGTTHLVMSPLEFMQRPAAQVTRPRQLQPTTASRLAVSAVGYPDWVVLRLSTIKPLVVGRDGCRPPAPLPLAAPSSTATWVDTGRSGFSIQSGRAFGKQRFNKACNRSSIPVVQAKDTTPRHG